MSVPSHYIETQPASIETATDVVNHGSREGGKKCSPELIQSLHNVDKLVAEAIEFFAYRMLGGEPCPLDPRNGPAHGQ